MDSSHLDQADKSSPETSSESSMSLDSTDNNDIFGDPSVHPRVGDEYQVEIPSLLTDSKGTVDSSYFFLPGLSIPVTWACNQTNPIKTERLEDHDDTKTVYSSGLVGPTKSNGKGLVPCQPTELWSDFEEDCFLVGLYLLGKNLVQVKRFVESKGMGQVLAYYYGQFYASAGYNRWSACRKMRSRKCVIGHNFFTGYRQQELFSRLSPHVSEESKTKLLEASTAFAEGSISLDEYVFRIKALVGTLALVNAIGIGKGKEDLTTLIFDGPKNNPTISHRPEIPSGKAWSSLTCAEIVKYLTGNFRLSKARSNDLFWEAIWPRLLARGWRSEQPKGDGYKGSNHLVFLMPGIKKFSRRKLLKGDHYFDSVSDVLSKVASEPSLIEIEADETAPSCSKEENGWSPNVKTDDDQDYSDHERHCYLKPRVSLGNSDLTKFTIVDTSLANEDNPYKVRELRFLNEEAERSFAITRRKSKIENKLLVNGNVLTDGFQSSSFSTNLKGLSNDNGLQNSSCTPCLPMNHKPRSIKHQFSRRVKSGLSGCVGSVTKRRRLSSCVDADVTFVLGLPTKKKATLRILGPTQTPENVLVAVIHTEKGVQDSVSGNQAICLNLPQVPTKPESDGTVKLEEEVCISNQTSNVEKTKHFDYEKQRRSYVEEKRHSHSEIPTRSNAKNPKKFIAEKQKSSEDMVDTSDKSVSQASSNKVVQSGQQLIRHFDEKNKISDDTVNPSDKTEPQASSCPGEASNEILQSDQQSTRHFVAEKQKITENVVCSSGIVEPQLSCTSRESSNKAVKSDQQPRRQSTRSRPLTTKALEALEVGLSPVRPYRKRSPSAAQDQKPKRVRKSRNKIPIFSHETVLEAGASKETSNGIE